MSANPKSFNTLSAAAIAFVEQVKADAEHAFNVLRDTNTLTAAGTVSFTERIPGEDKLVSVQYPGPWKRNKPLEAGVVGLDGTLYQGESRGDRWLKLFNRHPDVTTISHFHSPYLAAFAQTHRTFHITYVPPQRHALIRDLPIYIDRRQSQEDFILDQLAANPRVPAILEANGGSTAWGKEGLLKLGEFILLLEEGAQVQHLAQTLGGSREYGPNVLALQWKRRNWVGTAKELGLLSAVD
jgi:L-ribulose-5-phosphate 4-epimerase